MARSYATIQCSIWDDDDFVALSPEAQATYFMLVTQSDIEACGSLALTVRRWARYVAAGDPGRLTGWLNELVAARFVLVDKETEELLVRTFAKYDGGYKHSMRLKAVVASAEAIRSRRLRQAIAVELARLGVETGIPVPAEPRASASPVPTHGASPVPAEPLSSPTTEPPESLSSATAVPVESQRSVVTTAVTTNRTPHSTNHKGEPVALTSDAPAPEKAGPDDRWCDAHHPGGTDEPCGQCARKREFVDRRAAQRAEAERAQAEAERHREAEERRALRELRRQEVDACSLCDHTGYRLRDDGTTGGVCNHQPLNTGGLARARAALHAQEATA